MALYEELKKVDILGAVMPAIAKRTLPKPEADEFGNPKINLKLTLEPDTPWLHHHWSWERRCDLWTIYFHLFNIIPRGCRACWKVPIRIPRLKELFHVYEKQADFGYNCKCGVERRPHTGAVGCYHGFFYGKLNEGLDGGRKVFRKVRKEYPGMSAYLKRGCTEFEHRFPPSDKWDEMAKERGWDMIEAMADSLFTIPPLAQDRVAPKMLEVRVMTYWIEWAFEHSHTTKDYTYKEYIEGNMLPELVRYENLKLKDSDLEDSIYEGKDHGTYNHRLEGLETKRSDVQESAEDQREEISKGKSGEKEGPSLTLLS